VADTFPASLTCNWTCVGAGGGTCTASGSGNINGSVSLPAGGSVTYTASCTISAAATGTLSNTATVTGSGVTDPVPGNNSATDSDTLSASADLAITKTDGVTTATPGGSTTYTITASNAGPSNASATVADTFPASLTCNWTCTGAGGGTCASPGSGNINGSVNLPAGGSVTYTASCTISAAATGTLSNTATVTGSGVTDPTPGNNSATDTDTLVAPTVSVSDVSLLEGNTGTTAFAFTASLSAPAVVPVTVHWATADGTATSADGDYQPASGTLSFGTGVSTRQITVLVSGDARFEPSETFFVNLSSPQGGGLTIADGQGQGTIGNDDSQPVISVDSPSVAEGNSGTTSLTFTVSLSNPSYQAVSVAFATANGTATAGSDYAATAGSLTFPAGSAASQPVNVTVFGDTALEASETVLLNLSAPVNGTIGTGTGTGTITNDDARPSLSINDVERPEGNSGTTAFDFTVTLSGPSAETVTVQYATADGIPAARGVPGALAIDADGRHLYAAVPGSAEVVTSEIDTDRRLPASAWGGVRPVATLDAGEAVSGIALDPQSAFALVTRSGGAVSAHPVSRGDLSVLTAPSLLQASVPVVVGAEGGFVYSATRNAALGVQRLDRETGLLLPVDGSPFALPAAAGSVTVDRAGRYVYVTHPDFDAVSVLAVDPGTGALAPVPGSPFAASQGPRALALHPSGAFAYVLAARSQDVLVYRVDAASGALIPQNGAGASTSDGPLALAVHPSGAFLAVANQGSGTVSGYSIDASNGALLPMRGSPWPAGRAPAAVAFHPSGRTAYALDAAAGSIVAWSVDARGRLTPLASSPQALPATAPATAGSDYLATSGTLTFAPGITTRTVSVSVLGDTTLEPDEQFSVVLSGAVNAGAITRSTGVGTLDDDERARMITPVPGTTLPGNPVTFTWSASSTGTGYWLELGTTPGGADLFSEPRSGLSATVAGLPATGVPVYARLWTFLPAPVGWVYFDYTYAAVTGVRAEITTPAPGSTLADSTVTFGWTSGTGVTRYWLYVGTALGGSDLYNADQGTAQTATVSLLPGDGRPVYVRLWSFIAGSGWTSADAQFTSATLLATMTAPPPGSTLTSTATFQWTAGSGALQYWLSIGTTLGGTEVYDGDQGLLRSATVAGLPTTGAVWVRLYTRLPGLGWTQVDYRYNP
jgi:uncharacterized repeat protein (TIGR01451 family)